MKITMTKSLTILSVLLLGALVSSQYHSTVNDYRECTTRICYSSRGYVKYRADPEADTNKIWTITNRQRFTTIVLHLKNIQIPDTLSSPWLRIYVQQETAVQKIEVENKTELFFSFSNSNEAIIEVSDDSGVEFSLNYYVGCVVMEGSDKAINKQKEVPKSYLEYLTKFSQFPTCWIIFPVTQEQKLIKILQRRFLLRGAPQGLQLSRNVEVEKMYLTFKDAWVPNGTSIHVRDLVTDTPVVEVGNIESLLVSTVENNSKRITYTDKESYMLSSVILVDLKCPQADDCRRTQFNFSSQGLQSRDISCIEQQSKCLFNIGDSNHDCRSNYTNPITAIQRQNSASMVTTSCPAFNRLTANIMDEVIFSQGGRQVTVRSGANMPRGSCQNYKSYCKKKCNKKIFKSKGCDKVCFFIKRVLNLCRTTNYFR